MYLIYRGKKVSYTYFSYTSTLATSCEELTHWKRLWCWEGLGAGGEGDDRGWDGWMASLTWWMWVWVNSGSWWWTGRPGMLRFMGSQRVGHDWTELNWYSLNTPWPSFPSWRNPVRPLSLSGSPLVFIKFNSQQPFCNCVHSLVSFPAFLNVNLLWSYNMCVGNPFFSLLPSTFSPMSLWFSLTPSSSGCRREEVKLMFNHQFSKE